MSSFIGNKYGKLTVLSVSKRKGNAGQTYLHCACDCGKEKEIRFDNLVGGHTLSCGCLLKRANRPKRVDFLISNRPSLSKPVSEEKKKEGDTSRGIESILAARALERELLSFM